MLLLRSQGDPSKLGNMHEHMQKKVKPSEGLYALPRNWSRPYVMLQPTTQEGPTRLQPTEEVGNILPHGVGAMPSHTVSSQRSTVVE